MIWQEVIEDSNVWVYEYVANGYKANAVAVTLEDGELAIVSPPIGLSEADFTEIDAKGQVTALIAPHSAHDLGQNEWQARYPDAIPYAPTIAIEQLKHVGQRSFTPVSKLFASTVEFREVPGTKKGGTIAISRRGKRPIVYLDELIINWSSLPHNWTRFWFQFSNSAPRLRVNQIYKQMFCPDLQAVVQTVLGALEGDPAIVPAHGTPLVQVGDAARVRALVESLTKPVAN
ncbi:MAG: hypothetical protein KME42_00070 [Tildeniella nuda ZEHNDER 1965/U140]|nr:hypothetical protein [Tildeniella nuda ZEHNDER 1965/U140]